jgi:hypothetical protein
VTSHVFTFRFILSSIDQSFLLSFIFRFKERSKFEKKMHDPRLSLSRIAHRLSMKLGSAPGDEDDGLKEKKPSGMGLAKKKTTIATRRGIKVDEAARARRAALLAKKKNMQTHSMVKGTARDSRRRTRRERDFTGEEDQDEMLFGGIPDEIMMMKKSDE